MYEKLFFMSTFVNYIFLLFICVWEPLQVFILKVDGAQRTTLFLCVIAFFANITNVLFRRNIIKFPTVFWSIWVIYAFSISKYYGYDYTLPYTFFVELFLPLFIIWIINSNNSANKKNISNILIIGLYIRLILIIIFSFNEGELLQISTKMSSNEVALSALVLISILFMAYFNSYYKMTKILILSIMPIWVIILAASRNAFGGLCILLVIFTFINSSKKSIMDFIKLICFALIFFSVFNYILDTTYLGERIIKTEQQSASANLKSGTIFDQMGDRGIFYVLGFNIFLEHPITGIGLYNFKKIHGSLVQHSEYMIQLSELGLIGFGLFVLFYYYLFSATFYCKNCFLEIRRVYEFDIGILFVILFLGFSTRIFNSIFVFMLLGIIIGHINRNTNDNFRY